MLDILWKPSKKDLTSSQMALFKQEVNSTYSLSLETYQELHQWACNNPEKFWSLFWTYANIKHSAPFQRVYSDTSMPGVKWFEGSQLNYAENCLAFNDAHTAIIHCNESGELNRTSYKELNEKVSKCQQFLRKQGIQKGDRIAAVVTHCEETIVLFLAATSLGAVWTSCSPDFGEEALLSRLVQVDPVCFIYVDSYRFKNKQFSITDKLVTLQNKLNTINTFIHIDRDCLTSTPSNHWQYSSILTNYKAKPLIYEQVNFNDPLYILYSSGTTGKPKAIVHSVGGALIEHIKEQRLHCDLTREDVFFYYTSCSWMMWNWLVSGLASGATLVVFDGAPFYPNKLSTWELIDQYGITIYGTSAKYINASLKFNLDVNTKLNLSTLRLILSTGSPLYDEDFDYIYTKVKPDVQLASISGGTDIVGCFALGNPLLPVRRGQLQSISLGYPVQAYNEEGIPVIDSKGELVCEGPVPSMPIYFWNDTNFEVYKNSYFSKYKSIWSHSDYVMISQTGGVKILGRSDATLNRAGIRIGTAEIYSLVESSPDIDDSLVIHIESKDHMILFVKLAQGYTLDASKKKEIKDLIKTKLSPRHSPNHIFEVSALPYTKNGKKIELAIKYLFINQPEKINVSSLQDASVLDEFKQIKEANFASS